jgi:hypothetical protein
MPPMGYFSGGVRTAPVGVSGRISLALASGLDMSPQPLALYDISADQRPRWYSDDIDYLGRVTVGDIDNDGINDAVVAVLFDKALHFDGGAIKIYRGSGDAFVGSPSQTLHHAPALAMALGDVDGDGDLDLATGIIANGGSFGDVPPPAPGPVYVYANDHGRFVERPMWQSDENGYVGALTFTDVDQDGRMDLIVAGDRARLYRGTSAADGSTVLSARSSWQSVETWQVGYGVAVAPIGRPARRALVVSPTCLGEPCQPVAPVAYYLEKMREPSTPADWMASSAGIGGGIAVGDFDGDGLADLLAGRIIEELEQDADPLRYYPGNASTFATAPVFCTQTTFVAPSLAPIPGPSGAGITVARESFSPTTPRGSGSGSSKGAVFAVSHAILAVDDVMVDGSHASRTSFTYEVGGDAVALSNLAPAAKQVTVVYRWLDRPDVAVAEWRSGLGTGVLSNATRSSAPQKAAAGDAASMTPPAAASAFSRTVTSGD